MEFKSPAEFKDPFELFDIWFQQHLKQPPIPERDPTAMCVSSCINGKPSSRMVLLKSFSKNGYIFYTHYTSRKGREILQNPNVALLFYWGNIQIRIEGRAEKLSDEESDAYFHSRPRLSQAGAVLSKQSQPCPDRAEFLKQVTELEKQTDLIPRPKTWGGIKIVPNKFEFWKAGDFRLHERYFLEFI